MTTKEQQKVNNVSLDQLFIDQKAIEEGEWVGDMKDAPGVRVKTRGWNCAAAQARRTELLEQRPAHLVEGSDEFAEAKESDPVGHAKQLSEVNKQERSTVLKEILILDWDGLGGIPFSPQNLEVICANEGAMPARAILLNAALKCGDMRGKREEAQLKNFVAGLGISFDIPDQIQTP